MRGRALTGSSRTASAKRAVPIALRLVRLDRRAQRVGHVRLRREMEDDGRGELRERAPDRRFVVEVHDRIAAPRVVRAAASQRLDALAPQRVEQISADEATRAGHERSASY